MGRGVSGDRVSAERVRAVMGAMDGRGAWVEGGEMRAHGVRPEGGVIESGTFVRNVRVLCEYVRSRP